MARGGKREGAGRPVGAVAPATALLKDAILKAGEAAGGEGGLVAYLTAQATANPGPFLSLLGKVLPMQIGGDPGNPIQIVTKDQRDAAVAAAIRADS